MTEYKMWIAGKWVDAESGKTYPVFNPATEAEIAQVPLGGKADVDKAVEAARKAFPIWSKKSQADRSQIVITATGASARFEWAAYNARSLMGHTVPVSADTLVYLQREPVGVVAIITPWNVPIMMIAEKLAPALALGNTCIIKPPSIDSLIALKLAELLDTVGLPPGTVNVVTGPGSTVGEALACHRGVDMVAFTGSCETGKEIMTLAGNTVKRLQMELGGKNPVIILDDADVSTAATALVRFQFSNSGQVCAAPGRFYVHEKVYDEFLEKFTTATKKMVVGDPNEEKTEIGPLVSAEHRNKVEGYIKSAVDEGAKIILGGERPLTPPINKGYFVMPTIITGVTQKMKVAKEEIFGPVACFMEPFNSDEKVIESANDTTFGLAAYIWTRDAARGMRLANSLSVGTVWLNNSVSMGPELPWGGYKESGFGKEGSLYGLYEYTNLKRVHVDLMAPKK